jgi:hypothetical protein
MYSLENPNIAEKKCLCRMALSASCAVCQAATSKAVGDGAERKDESMRCLLVRGVCGCVFHGHCALEFIKGGSVFCGSCGFVHFTVTLILTIVSGSAGRARRRLNLVSRRNPTNRPAPLPSWTRISSSTCKLPRRTVLRVCFQRQNSIRNAPFCRLVACTLRIPRTRYAVDSISRLNRVTFCRFRHNSNVPAR